MSLKSEGGMLYWQGKTEELVEKPVPVPLCPTQIPYGLTRSRTLASAVRGRRLTTWAMARLWNYVLQQPITPHGAKTQDDTTNNVCYFQTLFCIRLLYIYNCINTSPSLIIFIQLKINQIHMAQVVSRRPITAEVQVRVQVSPYEICGGQHGTETDYCPSCSVFPCLCYIIRYVIINVNS
jgi:hypothetical protein